jgi:UDP-N-acetylmuramate-alanine ligase
VARAAALAEFRSVKRRMELIATARRRQRL